MGPNILPHLSLQMRDFIARILSRSALARPPSPIRTISNELLALPPGSDMLSLAGGSPSPRTFPFSSISVSLKHGTNFHITGAELAEALQYNRTTGLSSLTSIWSDLLEAELSPAPGSERSTMVTTGAEFGSYLTLCAILDPEDWILVADPAYPPLVLKGRALEAGMVGIPEDPVVGGLCPRQLKSTLESWPSDRKKPKALMVCPTGSNPSGANIPTAHRRAIYEIACEHDLLLIEDDPYYFLNYGESAPSFLHYDTEGRVVRLDSLSKVLCPGLRVGFLTGPPDLISILERHYAVCLLNSCNVSQAIAVGYLREVGHAGFLEHTLQVANYYRTQRDMVVQALDKHMSDLATWIVPRAGMFVWLKLNNVKDTSSLARAAMDNGVAFVPGSAFQCDLGGSSPYLRLAFSVVPPDRIDEAIRRLADTVARES